MLSLSQTPLTHSTPLTRHCHTLAERRHLHQYNSIASIIRISSQSSSHQAKPIKQSVMINQSVSQSIPSHNSHSIIQSFAPHNTASPLSISHQLKRSVILRQPLFLSRHQSFCQFSLLLHMYVLSLARNTHITQQHSTLQSLAHKLHSH